ncbi:MAG: hypothetical protein ABUL53_09795, partial [Bradyrhizobium guangdongense]
MGNRVGDPAQRKSTPRAALAAAGMVLVAVVTMVPATVEAGFRIRGGPVGVARFAVTRVLSVAGLRHARAAMRPQDLNTAVRPMVRTQATAMAALGGWQGGRLARANAQGKAQGWWQHADGTYGWVG